MWCPNQCARWWCCHRWYPSCLSFFSQLGVQMCTFVQFFLRLKDLSLLSAFAKRVDAWILIPCPLLLCLLTIIHMVFLFYVKNIHEKAKIRMPWWENHWNFDRLSWLKLDRLGISSTFSLSFSSSLTEVEIQESVNQGAQQGNCRRSEARPQWTRSEVSHRDWRLQTSANPPGILDDPT